ncbi:MAG: thioredoxin domain-containing protein [Planctomycetota bacterium]
MASNRKLNRLADEKSPYLLQHAANPVDWYPWGQEAFDRAKAEDRPIFLSIGYSTCHWCHVMERESFEIEATAAVMNELFVNIKVDREEHPDVDQIYMAAVQAIAGQGGWPMSVFLTPDLGPYYAGTYFPPEARYGRPGFTELLRHFAKLYHENPSKVAEQANQVKDWIASQVKASEADGPGDLSPLAQASAELSQGFDPLWGGFGQAPKFPRSMTLQALMRSGLNEGQVGKAEMLMVDKTLDMMWRGGIYDHIGGGFARYAVDDEWLVPHFEKMLYDNALLVLTYTEAWQVSHDPRWREVVDETLAWVMAEMTHEGGGFFSAQDADSEGEEGLFYVWALPELEEILGAEDAAFLAQVYDAKPGGNFEGRNILALRQTYAATADALGIDGGALRKRLDPLRRKLYEVRDQRIHPGLDDKVLSSWNGLMIAAMARAGAAFGEAAIIDVATQAAEFIESKLKVKGVLQRRWRDGEAALAGTLEDYAFLAFGYLALFEATMEPSWFDRARELVDEALEKFEDRDQGGFFLAAADTPNLILRMKEAHDAATPSGASVMVSNLLTLEALIGDNHYRSHAASALRASRPEFERHPAGFTYLLCGLDRYHAEPTEIVIAVGENPEEARAMLTRTKERYLPHAVTLVLEESDRTALSDRMPWLADKTPVDGKSALYLCRGRQCQLPVLKAEEVEL